jgi:hypothetical protein
MISLTYQLICCHHPSGLLTVYDACNRLMLTIAEFSKHLRAELAKQQAAK